MCKETSIYFKFNKFLDPFTKPHFIYYSHHSAVALLVDLTALVSSFNNASLHCSLTHLRQPSHLLHMALQCVRAHGACHLIADAVQLQFLKTPGNQGLLDVTNHLASNEQGSELLTEKNKYA